MTRESDQATKDSLRVIDRVECNVFDDKVLNFGKMVVTGGTITIKFDYLPSMVSSEATEDLLVGRITDGIRACYRQRPRSFDPNLE